MCIKKFKSSCKHGIFAILLGTLMVFNGTNLYATDLNGIGVQSTQVQQGAENQNQQNTGNTVVNNSNNTSNVTNNSSDKISNADAVGSLFQNLGPSEQDFEKANQVLRPLVTFINFLMAMGLGVLSALLLLITLIDLFYMCVPIIRKWLDGGRSQQGSTSGGMGMSGGMGGYGHGGMGMAGGMGGGQPSQAQSLCGQWVSDEAIVTFNECNPQQGGGGMGMGMGMQQSQPTASKKVMLATYAKKRIVFLFTFGMCVVLLFTTAFTELGINAGVWLLGKLSGLM